MSSSVSHARQVTLALSWRAAIIGMLALTAVYGLAALHLYGIAIVAIALGAALSVEVAHIIGNIEHAGERDLHSLLSAVSDETFSKGGPAGATQSQAERALSAIQFARARRESQIEYLQTLLDTVTSALIVLESGDRVCLANRAARMLAARPVERLEQIAVLDEAAARRLVTQAPGTRQIISLVNGGRMLASVSHFAAPGSEPRRLISLQRVAGELDAIELSAWNNMAHILAHEMMNSLTPIASLSETLEGLLREQGCHKLAESPELSQEVLAALEAIRRRSCGLMDFVGRYRALADLPAPRCESVPVHELLDSIARLLAAQLAERHIRLSRVVNPQPMRIWADPRLLEQALLNLLRNSIDALEGVAGKMIEINCAVMDKWARIAIADNGCGIATPLRDQVFVPFFTTKTGGFGIGLSLARQIAQVHGGQLELHVNEPRGCVFVLVLPAER